MSVVEMEQAEVSRRMLLVRRQAPIFRGTMYLALAALLTLPGGARARETTSVMTAASPGALQAPRQDQQETGQDSQDQQQDQDQEKRDREQEARDREQEKRDREQEKRDREQERRDREREKTDRVSELYDDGREDLDEDRYDQAAAKFAELAALNGPQTDAALYWKAYAENRLGKRDVALATIADLKHRFPQSRWQKDASALEIDVRQHTGQASHPETQSDDDLKMLAIQGLMNSDPERAMPLLEKVLTSTATPREKSKALFVIAQSGSPQARQILGRIASGQSNPDLQRKAVEYLGIFGGGEARKTLAEVYAKTNDEGIKRAILKSFMICGDKEDLFMAAKNEKNEQLRIEAIRQLGLVHGVNELQQLYKSELTPGETPGQTTFVRRGATDVRAEILKAFFLAGDSTRLVEAANSEKDPELRRIAIRNLGLINSPESAQALKSLYAKESDRGVKEEVLNAYFIQGNASGLVAIARGEKDPELKKQAVSKLALMHNKEATDYLMEILQK